jgi:hypothetical protein
MVESAALVAERVRKYPRHHLKSDMKNKHQFEMFWEVGCKRAIWALIKNKGKALSMKQINGQLSIAIRNGLVAHASKLAELRGTPLRAEECERLVRRCLELGWIPDALSAARTAIVSSAIRRELLKVAVSNKLAKDQQEAESLLDDE